MHGGPHRPAEPGDVALGALCGDKNLPLVSSGNHVVGGALVLVLPAGGLVVVKMSQSSRASLRPLALRLAIRALRSARRLTTPCRLRMVRS